MSNPSRQSLKNFNKSKTRPDKAGFYLPGCAVDYYFFLTFLASDCQKTVGKREKKLEGDFFINLGIV